jgi:hypothetical protein
MRGGRTAGSARFCSLLLSGMHRGEVEYTGRRPQHARLCRCSRIADLPGSVARREPRLDVQRAGGVSAHRPREEHDVTAGGGYIPLAQCGRRSRNAMDMLNSWPAAACSHEFVCPEDAFCEPPTVLPHHAPAVASRSTSTHSRYHCSVRTQHAAHLARIVRLPSGGLGPTRSTRDRSDAATQLRARGGVANA